MKAIYKRILGYILATQFMPLVCMTINIFDTQDTFTMAYIYGWIVNIAVISVVGSITFVIWLISAKDKKE